MKHLGSAPGPALTSGCCQDNTRPSLQKILGLQRPRQGDQGYQSLKDGENGVGEKHVDMNVVLGLAVLRLETLFLFLSTWQ